MEDNKFRINIVEDDGDKIKFEKVFDEEVVRTETEEIEKAIAEIESEIADRNAKLVVLKEKIAFNKYVIEYADKIKAEAEAKAKLEAEQMTKEPTEQY